MKIDRTELTRKLDLIEEINELVIRLKGESLSVQEIADMLDKTYKDLQQERDRKLLIAYPYTIAHR